jgi:C4-dicarboxylate transporter DctM subunit
MAFLMITLLGFMLLGIPVAFAILGSSVLTMYLDGNVPWSLVIQRMYYGLTSFPLVAVPLFILAGELLEKGGILRRLLDFANLLIGRRRAGLAYGNVVASIFFAGITGAATADAAGLGKIEIAIMKEDGYSTPFSGAVTAASAIIGPIIPPSIPMIIYTFAAANVSLGALFFAGILPGILIGGLEMLLIYFIARRRGFSQKDIPLSARQFFSGLKQAALPLVMPLIILGGIYGGIFTPTEAAAVAVVYAFFIGIFVLRTLRLRDLPNILTRTAYITSVVMWIVAGCTLFSWLLTVTGVGKVIHSIFKPFMDNPLYFLLVLNVILLVVGTFMDAVPAILILAPILAPLAERAGIDPTHFGIVMIINLCIGLITPPIGVVLFSTCAVAEDLTLSKLSREILPFLAILLIALILITFIPELSLLLPRMAGLI